ncbi:TetR family transcriptional regulator [Mycobacteroides abscessus]|nr:TetR family transcriptional regulator [Mycobacteroides abscessus]MDM2424619.1 TetR family transcriptional regulator [Mycobacteroides abscessus]MDM2429851.1 TetR family transcriptional regulator [Mycobacteroides abscessus]MDM2434181.1 TetR family transcriptional regulator [Mycobacteroides abscessus]MDM2442780.1 TetR family transcriptional regulator [Mycobacteroides abscessus]
MISTGTSTRERLLDAAEQVLLAEGLEGLSIAKVTAQAGTNLAAVNYTFGSKDALLHALLQRILVPLTEERIRRIDAFAASRKRDVVGLTSAFMGPLLELNEHLSALFFELMLKPLSTGRETTRPDNVATAVQQIGGKELEPGVKRFVDELAVLTPARSRDELYARVGLAIGAASALYAQPTKWGNLSDKQRIANFINFLAAGFAA